MDIQFRFEPDIRNVTTVENWGVSVTGSRRKCYYMTVRLTVSTVHRILLKCLNHEVRKYEGYNSHEVNDSLAQNFYLRPKRTW
jgi:hypothetical protein